MSTKSKNKKTLIVHWPRTRRDRLRIEVYPCNFSDWSDIAHLLRKKSRVQQKLVHFDTIS